MTLLPPDAPTSDPRAALRPLLLELSEALASAGAPRLAAWARLRHRLLGLEPGAPLVVDEALQDALWAARDEAPTEPELLRHAVLLSPCPSVWAVARSLDTLPDGEARAAVAAVLARISARTGEDLPRWPFGDPARRRALEALEEALARGGQRAALAACVAFRLASERLGPRIWSLAGNLEAWLGLSGPLVRGGAWLCVGDVGGLADQVRPALDELPDAACAAVTEALGALLATEGLPPEATGEARHAARRAALADLAEAVAGGPVRARVLVGAFTAALEGDPEEARRQVARCPRLGRGRRLMWQAHVAVGDLPWLVARLRPMVRGRKVRQALRALARLP